MNIIEVELDSKLVEEVKNFRYSKVIKAINMEVESSVINSQNEKRKLQDCLKIVV